MRELRGSAEFVEAFARVECHYMANNCFLHVADSAGLLRGASVLAHIPTHIVHGRLDMVCRPRMAFTLHKQLPTSTLQFVYDAGHSVAEPGILDAVLRVTDELGVALQAQQAVAGGQPSGGVGVDAGADAGAGGGADSSDADGADASMLGGLHGSPHDASAAGLSEQAYSTHAPAPDPGVAVAVAQAVAGAEASSGLHVVVPAGGAQAFAMRLPPAAIHLGAPAGRAGTSIALVHAGTGSDAAAAATGGAVQAATSTAIGTGTRLQAGVSDRVVVAGAASHGAACTCGCCHDCWADVPML